MFGRKKNLVWNLLFPQIDRTLILIKNYVILLMRISRINSIMKSFIRNRHLWLIKYFRNQFRSLLSKLSRLIYLEKNSLYWIIWWEISHSLERIFHLHLIIIIIIKLTCYHSLIAKLIYSFEFTPLFIHPNVFFLICIL